MYSTSGRITFSLPCVHSVKIFLDCDRIQGRGAQECSVSTMVVAVYYSVVNCNVVMTLVRMSQSSLQC